MSGPIGSSHDRARYGSGLTRRTARPRDPGRDDGNRYSVPPGLVDGHVQNRWRPGTEMTAGHAHGQLIGTHPLAPRGPAAVDAGLRTYYTTVADLAARCRRAAITGRWATIMRFFNGPSVLIVDASGYRPIHPPKTPAPCSRSAAGATCAARSSSPPPTAVSAPGARSAPTPPSPRPGSTGSRTAGVGIDGTGGSYHMRTHRARSRKRSRGADAQSPTARLGGGSRRATRGGLGARRHRGRSTPREPPPGGPAPLLARRRVDGGPTLCARGT